MALPPGTRPNCSLAPPLPPRSMASLFGPPTRDSVKLKLGNTLISKEHRLAAWPSHLGLDQTAAWLLPYVQDASPRSLAFPPGTRTNFRLAPSLPPRSNASLLGAPSWDTAKLQIGSSLTSKEHRLTVLPFHLGLTQTADWLLPYLQGASPRCLAFLPLTRPYCSLALSLPPMSIASLLGPPAWDSAKLQLSSFLTSKMLHLAAWPSQLGLRQTSDWLLTYL
ncbi:hypothetical protein Adt_35077 [Abeliophyllum distichum]|uniref:Uncharacterized protein n=1 Tax=Abeliophyllum distichum TaxID=126358 RepID=A0ABD1QHQ7_9LAMI